MPRGGSSREERGCGSRFRDHVAAASLTSEAFSASHEPLAARREDRYTLARVIAGIPVRPCAPGLVRLTEVTS